MVAGEVTAQCTGMCLYLFSLPEDFQKSLYLDVHVSL